MMDTTQAGLQRRKALAGRCAQAELCLARLHLQEQTRAVKRSIARWRQKVRFLQDRLDAMDHPNA